LKVLVSWLREFVDPDASIEQLADTLGSIGFEVASVEPAPEGLDPQDRPDAVIDLEINANRPDCMSVIGVAREIATAFRLPFSAGPPAAINAADGATLPVEIADPDLCARYVASIAEVKIGPSPAWMAQRLQASGIRPINNVVDVTNYVLLETGHPMHAFDLARLDGPSLVIRRARGGERVTTLDGVTRDLTTEMLVIADARVPQAIGGVMGGAASEVHEGTRQIVFESAWFAPSSVRRTSRRLALKTEASSRFERGADLEAPPWAMERARQLLQQIGAGTPSGALVDRYPARQERRRVTLRSSRIDHLLGHTLDPAIVAPILERLGFDVEAAGSADTAEWTVGVPSWRIDVAREVDLIEEVARHYGYDRIAPHFPPLDSPPAAPDARLRAERIARQVLGAAGFSEAITWAFIERDAAAALADDDQIAALANPLSEKLAVLRPSMVAGLVESLGHNRRRERRDVQLYEIGSRFDRAAGETRAVAFAWTGAAAGGDWSTAARAVDFFDLKGVVEQLARAFGVEVRFESAMRKDLVPGRSASIVLADEKRTASERELGHAGQLAPAVAAARDLPPADEVYVAELNLDRLARLLRPPQATRVEPLPRFPSIVRDLSIEVDEALPAADVRGTIRAAAPATLVTIREFDRYQGAGVAAGSISLSLRLTFRSAERTLTDAEVDAALAKIVAALESAHGAKRR
jgi:phenylalanyl-tRNA synthetase beta chain